jgi:preprotein translocase subunit SecE
MNLAQKTTEYLRTAKAEMEKVSWPSQQDTIRYSALVIGISVTVAVFFALLDTGLNKLVSASLASRQSQSVEQSIPVVPNTTPDAATTPIQIDDVKAETK